MFMLDLPLTSSCVMIHEFCLHACILLTPGHICVPVLLTIVFVAKMVTHL